MVTGNFFSYFWNDLLDDF
jgi:hypothetical protein